MLTKQLLSNLLTIFICFIFYWIYTKYDEYQRTKYYEHFITSFPETASNYINLYDIYKIN